MTVSVARTGGTTLRLGHTDLGIVARSAHPSRRLLGHLHALTHISMGICWITRESAQQQQQPAGPHHPSPCTAHASTRICLSQHARLYLMPVYVLTLLTMVVMCFLYSSLVALSR